MVISYVTSIYQEVSHIIKSRSHINHEGLVPFYPYHEHPTISCPICPSKHATALFWIRGRDDWQHDQSIPSECFQETRTENLKATSPEAFALAVSPLYLFTRYGLFSNRYIAMEPKLLLGFMLPRHR